MFSHYTARSVKKGNRSVIKGISLNAGGIRSYHNLANKKVLLLGQNFVEDKTIVKIFSQVDMNSPIAEKTLEGIWDLLCIFPNGSILLANKFSLGQFIKLCHKNLNTIFSQAPQNSNILSSERVKAGAYSVDLAKNDSWTSALQPVLRFLGAFAIDNDTFFLVKEPEEPYGKPSLLIYQWKEDNYIELAKKELNTTDTEYKLTNNVRFLEKNRYYYEMDSRNGDLDVLIFKIEVDSNSNVHVVNEKPIKLKSPFAMDHFTSVALPNGNLLFYCSTRAEIWNLETFTRIKKWSWRDIPNLPKELLRSSFFDLISFPFADSNYLLLSDSAERDVYLFNVDKFEMKRINQNFKINNDIREMHMLSNGRILFPSQRSNPENNADIIQFDLKKIMKYRKEVTKSNWQVKRLFSERGDVPAEITSCILDYTFDQNAVESEEKDNKNCICM